jgi:two-component system, OmpR family, response regulator
MRVLLLEDDTRIARDVTATLEGSGFTVERESDGEEGWFKGDTEDYDAVILDLGLPKLDGLTILKRWRANGRAMPVLILTARGSWSERVDGIESGADDYLPKPFHMEELLARLRAILRRSAGQSSPVLAIGKIALDTRRMRITLDGVPVAFTPQEYRLFSYLMHHAGRVVPHTELLERLYSHDNDKDANAIEVLIGRIRRKLGSDVIETRRGFGYIVESQKL